jgi:hypothetical protein
VALVQHLPERNLGIARDVDILRTIRHELHESTSHIVFMFHINIIFFSWTHAAEEKKTTASS